MNIKQEFVNIYFSDELFESKDKFKEFLDYLNNLSIAHTRVDEDTTSVHLGIAKVPKHMLHLMIMKYGQYFSHNTQGHENNGHNGHSK